MIHLSARMRKPKPEPELVSIERRVMGAMRFYSLNTGERGNRSLTYREVVALVAVRRGLARMRWRSRHCPYYSDQWLEPECDAHGVGYGTLSGLQNLYGHKPLITTPTEPGLIRLTRLGNQVVDAILRESGRTEAEFFAEPAKPIGAAA
jgi:hypothetical protein